MYCRVNRTFFFFKIQREKKKKNKTRQCFIEYRIEWVEKCATQNRRSNGTCGWVLLADCALQRGGMPCDCCECGGSLNARHCSATIRNVSPRDQRLDSTALNPYSLYHTPPLHTESTSSFFFSVLTKLLLKFHT